jgi:hypothetical protein
LWAVALVVLLMALQLDSEGLPADIRKMMEEIRDVAQVIVASDAAPELAIDQIIPFAKNVELGEWAEVVHQGPV